MALFTAVCIAGLYGFLASAMIIDCPIFNTVFHTSDILGNLLGILCNELTLKAPVRA